ncbi:tripartite tricarboxylate transporter substrate binding protein [Priestia flexa]|uniref:tripartite tricarboxylate transporter substrate binding protein n=1 Tax=Priestia TaxID=2800373 RepID=UPI00289194EA|nr:tripartite tricarboxylate transporter substrate-binding protein [Priestia flexa]MDT2047971.1 tripartite tricarboxylate transporter substrate-binding protein [Priestia flexa]
MKKWVSLISVILMLMSCSNRDQNVQFDHVELVAPGAVGGGADLTARTMQHVLQQEVMDIPVSVVNKTQSQGEEAWRYVQKHEKGNVISGNSSLLITNHLLGQSQLTYKDFTPLAILATEWEVIVVPSSSSITTMKSLMDALRENHHLLKIGLSPRLGNDDHLSFVQAAQKANVETSRLAFYVYGSSHGVLDALQENEVQVAPMSLSEAKSAYKRGDVRILGISAPQRLAEFNNVPTWKEEGVDVVFSHWRGLMGPPNMTQEEIDYWNQTIYKMVNTKAWKQLLKENDFYPFYKNSSGASVFLERQSKLYEELMNGK